VLGSDPLKLNIVNALKVLNPSQLQMHKTLFLTAQKTNRDGNSSERGFRDFETTSQKEQAIILRNELE